MDENEKTKAARESTPAARESTHPVKVRVIAVELVAEILVRREHILRLLRERHPLRSCLRPTPSPAGKTRTPAARPHTLTPL